MPVNYKYTLNDCIILVYNIIITKFEEKIYVFLSFLILQIGKIYIMSYILFLSRFYHIVYFETLNFLYYLFLNGIKVGYLWVSQMKINFITMI